MVMSTHSVFRHDYNPIDIVENIFVNQSWEFERRSSHEIAVEFEGKWCNIILFFAWEKDMRALHISCITDLITNSKSKHNMFELLTLANEQLWVGHFTIWSGENMPIYKHSILLNENERILPNRINEIINIAIKESEKFYPAFKYVINGGSDPAQALSSIMMETMGEA
jgi:hypothetical protein